MTAEGKRLLLRHTIGQNPVRKNRGESFFGKPRELKKYLCILENLEGHANTQGRKHAQKRPKRNLSFSLWLISGSVKAGSEG